ncbi:hypothetical protein [Spirosoma arcticum]
MLTSNLAIVKATYQAVMRNDLPAARMVISGIAQVVWQEALGVVRGEYFLLSGRVLTARQAQEFGVVNEALPAAELLPKLVLWPGGATPPPAYPAPYPHCAQPALP